MIAWFKNKEEKQIDAFVDSLVQIVKLFQSNGRLSGTPLPGIAENTYRLLTETAVYISCIIVLGALAFSKEPDASLQADKLTIKWLKRFINSYTLIDPETGKECSEDAFKLAKRVQAVYREYSDVFISAMDPGKDSENRQWFVTELTLRFYANVIDDQDKARKSFADVMLFGAPFLKLSIDIFNGVKKIV
jgi:hypothetical protein